MASMSVAMVLVLIAAGLILVGLVLAIWGFYSAPEPHRGLDGEPAEKPSLLSVILELLKKLFTYMFRPSSPRWMRIAAFGVFLILLGIAFLLSAGIATLAGAGGDDNGGAGTDPSPTSTVSPTSNPS